MTKIATAHVEIKPVVNEEALQAILDRIQQAVAEAVERGMNTKPAGWVAEVETRGEGLALWRSVDGADTPSLPARVATDPRTTPPHPMGDT